MTFRELGYLSPESAEWIASNRRANGPWFTHADKLNRIAQRTSFLLSADENSNRELVSILLFLRALFHFQAVVLLAERGMATEARSLARGSLEAAFCLKALVADETFLDQLVRADAHHRKNIVTALTSPSQRAFLDPARIAELEKFLSSLRASGDKTVALKIERVAMLGGLHGVYQTIYRALSGDASHVSALSLNRYLAEEADGKVTIVIGPLARNGDISDTLQAASLSLHACLDGLISLFKLDAIEPELGDLRSEYSSLTQGMAARLEAENA